MTSLVKLSPMIGSQRFSPPPDTLTSQTPNDMMRLEMSGAKVFSDPFGF
jgi:hypothetical protein